MRIDKKVTVTLTAESPIIESLKRSDLREFLDAVPDEARLTWGGISAGKARIVATWKEER